MRKVNFVFLLSLMILVIAGCSKLDTQPELLDSSDDVTLKKKGMKNFVPFKASFELAVDVQSILLGPNVPAPPSYYEGPDFKKYQFVYGEGKATHLGKTGVNLEQWWRSIFPPPPPYSGVGIGEVIFKAANGNLLLADYNDAVSFHETATYVEITFTGHFKDGGTSRFANAEGYFYWVGVLNPVTNFGTVTVTGEIKYSK